MVWYNKWNINFPCELPGLLDGQQFLLFLQNSLSVLLEEVVLNFRRNMWFQLHGDPLHFNRQVREFLTKTYQRKGWKNLLATAVPGFEPY